MYDTPLPPPMIPGANAGDTECLLDEDFRDIATSHNVRADCDSRVPECTVASLPWLLYAMRAGKRCCYALGAFGLL